MHRSLSASFVVAASLAAAAAAFASPTEPPSIHVQPSTVAPGGNVHVYGSAGSCPAGSRLIAISRAFPGHAFGEGSLSGRVRANHSYSIRGHVRAGAAAGRYSVGARCGGGNLGVHTHVRVS